MISFLPCLLSFEGVFADFWGLCWGGMVVVEVVHCKPSEHSSSLLVQGLLPSILMCTFFVLLGSYCDLLSMTKQFSSTLLVRGFVKKPVSRILQLSALYPSAHTPCKRSHSRTGKGGHTRPGHGATKDIIGCWRGELCSQ